MPNGITIRPLTKGPGFHWFGYYDKLQFSPSQQYVLAMQVEFEHRRPKANDVIKVGMIDLKNGNEWTPLGESRAWCWQMGCMLQWRPGSSCEVMWNDWYAGRFVSHILNVHSGEKKTLPFPFFSLHSSGKLALGLDFERLEYIRPGYGYAGVADWNKDVLAPKDMGIYLLDLEKGIKKLIISLARMASIPDATRDMSDCQHYCNCLLFNPEGSRFVFLHRWRTERGKGWPFKTRMLSASVNGTDTYVLVPGGCGHFNWRDNESLIVQENGFFIYKDKVGRAEQIGKGILPGSGGHISYLPGGKWIVGDTYPDDNRQQILYLYNTKDSKMLTIGSFESPAEYTGANVDNCDDEWRCDLHPRVSPRGDLITIDSPHGGNGRQIYLVDVSGITGKS
jgi:hypothetical protein